MSNREVLATREINGYTVEITTQYILVDGKATDVVNVREDGKIIMYDELFDTAESLLDDIAPSMYLT